MTEKALTLSVSESIPVWAHRSMKMMNLLWKSSSVSPVYLSSVAYVLTRLPKFLEKFEAGGSEGACDLSGGAKGNSGVLGGG